MRQQSAAAVNAMLSQETDEVFLSCLRIEHPELPEPLCFVNSRENLVHNNEQYFGFPFRIDLPDDDAESLPEISLTIDNVDRQIVEVLRGISSPPTVSHFVVMAGTPDEIEAGPFDMTLREADYNSTTVTGKLVWEDFLNLKYPAHDYAPANFPGLF